MVAISWYIGNLLLNKSFGGTGGDCFSIDAHLTADRMADTGKHLGKFNLAVALHAGHAHHFTGPDFQIHAVECLNATVVPGAEVSA